LSNVNFFSYYLLAIHERVRLEKLEKSVLGSNLHSIELGNIENKNNIKITKSIPCLELLVVDQIELNILMKFEVCRNLFICYLFRFITLNYYLIFRYCMSDNLCKNKGKFIVFENLIVPCYI
jgi:hypothetical protein